MSVLPIADNKTTITVMLLLLQILLSVFVYLFVTKWKMLPPTPPPPRIETYFTIAHEMGVGGWARLDCMTPSPAGMRVCAAAVTRLFTCNERRILRRPS